MKINSSSCIRFSKRFLSAVTVFWFRFLFLLFCVVKLNAQETDTVSRIVLSYYKGGNSWGNPGIYSRGEDIELVPDGKGNFVYSYYRKKTASAGSDGDTFSKDSVMVSVAKFKPVSGVVINEWLNELKTNRNNLTADYLLPFLDRPSKRQMKKVAALMDRADEFEVNEYNERSDIRRLVSSIRRFEKFEACVRDLLEASQNAMVIIDAYNKLRITVYSENNTTVYDSQFFDPLGQPVQRSFNGDYFNQTSVINLNANVAARRFLPEDSMMYNVLDPNTVVDYYIAWYLEKG